jgi:hypothetical protein
LLAEHLAARLKQTPPEHRAAIADRLGKLYVELIGAAKTTAERASWEGRARELLKAVPDTQSMELRLDLARASYLRAEEVAERWRIRLADAEAKASTERALKEVKQQLEQLGLEASRRADTLARAEEGGKSNERIAEDLADARRLRSTAFYFAGWAGVYLAQLSGAEAAANDALRSFGWLLNAGPNPGRPASLERAGRDLFKYDHIARSAIGCALACSAKGDDVGAMRWLSAVEEAADLPAPVRSTIPARKLAVLGAAKRWADVDRLLRQMRLVDRRGKPEPAAIAANNGKAVTAKPLDAPTARLLGVMVFEADRGAANELLEQLGQVALQDLVALGEIDQVADLASRYGTAPLGDRGFIVQYVRGIQGFTAAEKALAQAGVPAGEPAKDVAIINQLREAAGLLDAASEQDDAAQFPGERSTALVTAGKALARTGDALAAADRMAKAAQLATRPEAAAEALWLAILALDKPAGAGNSQAQSRLDELSTLFVRQYPQSERAATLLVKRAGQGGLNDDEALTVLLGVAKDSSVYESSRRQAVRILYRQFRTTNDANRAYVTARFIRLGEEVLAFDRRAATAPEADTAQAREAAERAVLTARQMLDALLAGSTPDLPRAEAVLAVVDSLGAFSGLDLGPVRAELVFRRLQVAVGRDDQAAAADLLKQLESLGPDAQRFVDAADRVAYQHALYRWARSGERAGGVRETALAEPVVRAGQKVIDQVLRNADANALKDASIATLFRNVAAAAAALWKERGGPELAEQALKLDRMILAAYPGNPESLVRVAELSEAIGRKSEAEQSWLVLVSGLPQGSPEWFRAKYESLRLLADSDRPAAALALAQLAVLYPDFGPPPWSDRLKALLQQVGPPPTPAAPAPREGKP